MDKKRYSKNDIINELENLIDTNPYSMIHERIYFCVYRKTILKIIMHFLNKVK